MIDLLEDQPASPTENRTCATCACSMVMAHPQELGKKQIVCRRDVPRVQDQRVRIKDPSDPTGKRTVEAIQRVIFHQPTMDEATCFDGWRPKGVQPGEPWGMLAVLAQLFEQQK